VEKKGGGREDCLSFEECAYSFVVNQDLVLAPHGPVPRQAFRSIRKLVDTASTPSKMSAMVLEDKLLMHTVVDRVAESCGGIKQLPLLHWEQNTLEGKTRETGGNLKDVKRLLAAGFGVFVKPSHGANNEGNAKVTPDKKEYFEKAMSKALSARYEGGSSAVARVLPGAIAQPLYLAPGVEFWNEKNHLGNFPLELKVQVMWGKAFLASTYHGALDNSEADLFFERPSLSSNEWRAAPFSPAEAPPDARYGNGGKVSLYLEQFLPKVASQAECLAGRLGAPWLRVDFFVPPPGAEGVPVVLNEIEYNSGVRWRRLQMPIEPWKRE